MSIWFIIFLLMMFVYPPAAIFMLIIGAGAMLLNGKDKD